MAEEKAPVQDYIMLRNVRLSFNDLFQAKQFEGKGDFKYSAKFIVDPGSANDKTIRAEVLKQATKGFGAKAAATMKQIEGQSLKHCYLDGDVVGRPEYAGKWVLTAKRNQTAGKVTVIDRDLAALTPEEGRPYSGCFVNAKVQIYAQTKGTGFPGMRCGLLTVQFYADGEAFGGAAPSDAEGFDNESEAAEEESLV